jgi:hypothetical protein
MRRWRSFGRWRRLIFLPVRAKRCNGNQKHRNQKAPNHVLVTFDQFHHYSPSSLPIPHPERIYRTQNSRKKRQRPASGTLPSSASEPGPWYFMLFEGNTGRKAGNRLAAKPFTNGSINTGDLVFWGTRKLLKSRAFY